MATRKFRVTQTIVKVHEIEAEDMEDAASRCGDGVLLSDDVEDIYVEEAGPSLPLS